MHSRKSLSHHHLSALGNGKFNPGQVMSLLRSGCVGLKEGCGKCCCAFVGGGWEGCAIARCGIILERGLFKLLLSFFLSSVKLYFGCLFAAALL